MVLAATWLDGQKCQVFLLQVNASTAVRSLCIDPGRPTARLFVGPSLGVLYLN